MNILVRSLAREQALHSMECHAGLREMDDRPRLRKQKPDTAR
jgi:hypothetical protein